jgi:hypothetical protein
LTFSASFQLEFGHSRRYSEREYTFHSPLCPRSSRRRFSCCARATLMIPVPPAAPQGRVAAPLPASRRPLIRRRPAGARQTTVSPTASRLNAVPSAAYASCRQKRMGRHIGHATGRDSASEAGMSQKRSFARVGQKTVGRLGPHGRLGQLAKTGIKKARTNRA